MLETAQAGKNRDHAWGLVPAHPVKTFFPRREAEPLQIKG